jgi:adenylate kinase
MPIFRRKHNTENLYFGNPEAESENNFKAKIKLDDVFEDYLNVLSELETEKFIITGRKGSGKSAIGQIIHKRAKNEPNVFCEYIRKSDIDLEEIVQLSEQTGNSIQKELLFKWIILTRLLKLITQNQAVQDLKDIKLIKHFLEKNSGFVNIDKYEIKEILQTTGFEILIEKLMHFFTLKKTRETRLSGTKAPFYKLIPHLEEVVVTILSSNADRYQGNNYKIIFDDLDIEFKAENERSVETLLNLIRISKNYNNSLFSENEIDAKVIVLLRDDISDILIKKSADMSKVFESYNIPLVWFDHDLHKKGENLTMLKQFIDKRIDIALKNEKIENDKNPWDFLFAPSSSYNDTSFKYVIDHTFHTPRDLILFMQGLSKYRFNLPMQINELNTLIGNYSSKAKGEIDNTLTIHFKVNEIDNLFQILRVLSKKTEFNFHEFETEFSGYLFSINATKCCELLFEYSLIGNKLPNSNMVFFKHRENNEKHYNIDFEKCFVIHRIIKIYFMNNK